MRPEGFSDRHFGAQQRRGDALAAAILWSTRAMTGLAQRAAAVLRRRVVHTAIAWHQRARERRQLLSLAERALRDIRLSRYDALHEGRKPLWRA